MMFPFSLFLILSLLLPTELSAGFPEIHSHKIALEIPRDLPEHLDSENPILAARAQ